MLGMKENLLDMLGVTFANRAYEAILRASKVEKHINDEAKYEEALKQFTEHDEESANTLDEAGTSILNICVEEAYYLGLQDGYSLIQLLTQSEKSFAELMEEARTKVEADKSVDLRPFGL